MKHSYRNNLGRFAKRPIGVPDTVMSAKDLPLVQPTPLFMSLKKNQGGIQMGDLKITCSSKNTGKSTITATQNDCPICEALEDIKKPVEEKPTSNVPKCEYDGDPDEFFDRVPHDGKPTFLRLDPNDHVNIRIIGAPLSYRQHFTNIPKPVKRYMVNVLDHADGKYKVLSCGKGLMREMVMNTRAMLEETKNKEQWTTLFDLVRNVLAGKSIKTEQEMPPIDFRVERRQPTPDPRTTRYNVKRIEA
jgi:hypothetical protein